jgi:hypothetical protein
MEYKGGVFKGRLNDDGLVTELYNYMWTVNSEDPTFLQKSLTIVDTVVYERGFPKVWYSWDTAQGSSHAERHEEDDEDVDNESPRRPPRSQLQLKKHLGKDIVLGAICKKFTRQAEHPVVAQYVTLEPSQSTSAERFADVCVEYLAAADLDAFFKKRAPGAVGVLQQFVSPQFDENVVFEVVWTASQVNINSRKNKNRLSAATIPLRERCTTFEGSHGVSSFCNVPEQTRMQIAAACTVLMNKMHSTESVPMTGLVAFIKIDRAGRPHLLFCTSIRSRLLEGIGKRDPLRVSVSYRPEDAESRTQRRHPMQHLPSSFAPPDDAPLDCGVLDSLEHRIASLNRSKYANTTPDVVALSPRRIPREVVMVGDAYRRREPPEAVRPPSTTSLKESEEQVADVGRRLRDLSESRHDEEALAGLSSTVVRACESLMTPKVAWREFPIDKFAKVRIALYDALTDALYTSLHQASSPMPICASPVKSPLSNSKRGAGKGDSGKSSGPPALPIYKFILPEDVRAEMTAERSDTLATAVMLGAAEIALDPISGEYVDLLHFRPEARLLTDEKICQAVVKVFPVVAKKTSTNSAGSGASAAGAPQRRGSTSSLRALNASDIGGSRVSLEAAAGSPAAGPNTAAPVAGQLPKTHPSNDSRGSSPVLHTPLSSSNARTNRTPQPPGKKVVSKGRDPRLGDASCGPRPPPSVPHLKARQGRLACSARAGGAAAYSPRWHIDSSFPESGKSRPGTPRRQPIAAVEREAKSALSPSRRRVYYAQGPRGPMTDNSLFGAKPVDLGERVFESTGDIMMDFWTQ